jgi:hypothetical protein
MKSNLGGLDKVIRIFAAVTIGALYFMHWIAGTLGIILLVVAGILILTSLVSFCPLYAVFGIRSNRQPK